ncbi:MAG: MHYT domain-containing protein, partial [Cystobacter sp.]
MRALSPVWSCVQCGGASSLPGDYHPGLVLLSLLIAVAAAYTSLELVGRVARTSGLTQRVILGCGAAMMGVGIWAMHFVGMLAVRMRMPLTYGMDLTLLSMVAAILGAWAALFVVSRRHVTPVRLLAGGGFMGLAITGMHYLGMSAMRMDGTFRYRPGLVALSLLIAVSASVPALASAFWSERDRRPWTWRKLGSALLMGTAIAGMHYTGMAAALFVPQRMPPGHATSGLRIDELGASAIGTVTLVWLGLTLLALLVEVEQRRVHRTLSLLADASALLGRSLDISTLAETLAGLVAPTVADGCLVDLLEEDGTTLRRVAVCFPSARDREPGYRDVRYTRDPESDAPVQRVLRTGLPQSLSRLASPERELLARAPEALALPRDADATTLALVPILHRDRVLGLLIVFTKTRPLERTEQALLQELGRRAGSALENARLYHEAQEAIRVRDEFLSIASHELNTPLTPLMMNLQRLRRTVTRTGEDPGL